MANNSGNKIISESYEDIIKGAKKIIPLFVVFLIVGSLYFLIDIITKIEFVQNIDNKYKVYLCIGIVGILLLVLFVLFFHKFRKEEEKSHQWVGSIFYSLLITLTFVLFLNTTVQSVNDYCCNTLENGEVITHEETEIPEEDAQITNEEESSVQVTEETDEDIKATAAAEATSTARAESTVPPGIPCLSAVQATGWRNYNLTIREGNNVPSGGRHEVYHACFDFADEGFEAHIKEYSRKAELMLGCGEKEKPCNVDYSYQGIYTFIDSGTYEFYVDIDSIGIDSQAYINFTGSNKQTPMPPVDTDLIIGIGNPIKGQGKFVFFRQIGPGGIIHICVLSKTTEICYPYFTRSPDSFGDPEKVVLQIDDTVKIYLGPDATEFGADISLDTPDQISLWVGYGINLEGNLSATIEFPEDLEYLLVKSE